MSKTQRGINNSQSGKIWIYNQFLKKNKSIYKEHKNDYLENGWLIGRVIDWNSFNPKEIKTDWDTHVKNIKTKTKTIAELLWQDFINGNYISLNDFSKKIKKPQPYLSKIFKDFILDYSQYNQRISIKKQYENRKRKFI